MLVLDFCDFDNFLLLDLSLRSHEALSNLFPHLHKLILAATALMMNITLQGFSTWANGLAHLVFLCH